MIHPGAIMVYVGKESGYHTRTQEEIHQLLLKYAGEGQSVLRLKVRHLAGLFLLCSAALIYIKYIAFCKTPSHCLFPPCAA